MADAAYLPTLEYFQWSTPDNPLPRLAWALTDSATTITWTAPPLDKDGLIVSNAFLIGIKAGNGYTETVYVPAGAVQWFGNVPDETNTWLSATGCVRGINRSGIDYETWDSNLAMAHEQDAKVFCNISAIHFSMMQDAQKWVIASGGNDWRIWNSSSNGLWWFW